MSKNCSESFMSCTTLKNKILLTNKPNILPLKQTKLINKKINEK